MNIRDQMTHFDESQAPYPPICQLRFFFYRTLFIVYRTQNCFSTQKHSPQIYLRVASEDPRVSCGFRARNWVNCNKKVLLRVLYFRLVYKHMCSEPLFSSKILIESVEQSYIFGENSDKVGISVPNSLGLIA